jgi:hypothetical protein
MHYTALKGVLVGVPRSPLLARSLLRIVLRLGARHLTPKNADIAMATFLKIFIVVLLVVLIAHTLVGWPRPGVKPGFSFLPGDIKYESPGGNVHVYFPIVTSIVLSVVLTLILRLFERFFGR